MDDRGHRSPSHRVAGIENPNFPDPAVLVATAPKRSATHRIRHLAGFHGLVQSGDSLKTGDEGVLISCLRQQLVVTGASPETFGTALLTDNLTCHPRSGDSRGSTDAQGRMWDVAVGLYFRKLRRSSLQIVTDPVRSGNPSPQSPCNFITRFGCRRRFTPQFKGGLIQYAFGAFRC